MLNNKKGNVFLGITIGLIIWIFGILVLSFFIDDITQARTDLQCSSPTSISSGTMLTCLMLDATVPYWIWTFASLTIGYFLGRGV